MEECNETLLMELRDGVSGAPRELIARMKSLNETILRQNAINEKLQLENKNLRHTLQDSPSLQESVGSSACGQFGHSRTNLCAAKICLKISRPNNVL